MKANLFEGVAANESSNDWNQLISRNVHLYERCEDIRSPFQRDYTRILHCLAYRRLKHKTQVFLILIELLEDGKRHFQNLNLTYAVRDGIISHCGEVYEKSLFPRSEYLPLFAILLHYMRVTQDC